MVAECIPLAADSSGAVRVGRDHLLRLARLWAGTCWLALVACSAHKRFDCDARRTASLALPARQRREERRGEERMASSTPATALLRTPASTRCIHAGATARSAASPRSAQCLVDEMPAQTPGCETGLASAQWRSAWPIASEQLRGLHSFASRAHGPRPLTCACLSNRPTLPSCSSLSPVSKRSHSRHILSLASHSS